MPTNIEWTDETWNPVTGCSKVSQGCKNCYALRDWPRLAANPKATAYFGRAFTDVAVHTERLITPLRWTKPRKVFVNSMSDLFHEDVPDAFIDQVMSVMWLCAYMGKGHAFQVLTKRAGRMAVYFQKDRTFEWTSAASNISHHLPAHVLGEDVWDFIASKGRVNPALWLGVSAEDQSSADERIPILLQTPAAVRWISAEPLLGEIDLTRICVQNWTTMARFQDALRGHIWDESAYEGGGPPLDSDPPDMAKLDWVVVGGESGPKARAMHPDWARTLRDQCAEAQTPFLFKQWGEYNDLMQHVGKKASGRLLDGVLHDGYPADHPL